MSVEVRTVGNQRQSAYGATAGDACAHSNFLEKGPRERNRTIVDNDLERRNYDGNRVVTQSLTDGFLLTITLWRDMDNVGSSGFSRNFGSWSSVVSRSHSWRALIFSESSCSCFPTVSVCEINVRSQKLVRVTRGRQIIRRLRLAIILLHISTTPFTSRLSVEVTLLQFMSGKNFPERDCSYTMWWFITEQSSRVIWIWAINGHHQLIWSCSVQHLSIRALLLLLDGQYQPVWENRLQSDPWSDQTYFTCTAAKVVFIFWNSVETKSWIMHDAGRIGVCVLECEDLDLFD